MFGVPSGTDVPGVEVRETGPLLSDVFNTLRVPYGSARSQREAGELLPKGGPGEYSAVWASLPRVVRREGRERQRV
jgi:hypothetical protein